MANRLDVFVLGNPYKGKDGKEHREWMKVGVAFQNKDGEGFSVILHAIPVDGKLIMVPPRERGVRGVYSIKGDGRSGDGYSGGGYSGGGSNQKDSNVPF